MRHASVELVAAMRGECPDFPFEPPNGSGPHARAACVPGLIANERVVWAYARGNSEDSWGPVDCPACLALMRDARGPDWDVVDARRAEEAQTQINAEIDAERRMTA